MRQLWADPLVRYSQLLDGIFHQATALAERAECVMLNKGSNVVAAIRMLDQILERTQRHQRKRRSLLPENPS